MWEKTFSLRYLAAALGLCFAVVRPALGAEHTFDGVYSGKRVLAKGSGPSCSIVQDVSVTIHGEILTFTDSNLRNHALAFYPLQDGSFSLIYFDAGRGTANIRGHIIGDIIDADVDNPPCGYHWHLKKQ